MCGNETLQNKKKYYGSLLTTNSFSQRIHQMLLKMLTLNLMYKQEFKNAWLRIKKNVYCLVLLNLSSLIALWYECFAQKILLAELAAYMNYACASYNKTTPLISKYFLRIQIKNQSTKNAYNSLWLRFINAWMAYLLILWVTSLNSEKIPTIWEIFIYLNLRIPEQKSLAYTAVHIQLVNFGKMFLRKFKIQPHFLCSYDLMLM